MNFELKQIKSKWRQIIYFIETKNILQEFLNII